MAFDFPTNPTNGQEYIDPATGTAYIWNGTGWKMTQVIAASEVLIGDEPPAAAVGQLWWESDMGILWIRFQDVSGDVQWVQAAGSYFGSAGGPVDTYTKVEIDAKFVELAGDTMTGSLTIAGAIPRVVLSASAGNAPGILGAKGASNRWLLNLGDTTAESGSATGSDFTLQAYDNMGAPLPVNGISTLRIGRTTGDAVFRGSVATAGALVSKPPAGSNATLMLDSLDRSATIDVKRNAMMRWQIKFTDTEAGGNLGSDLAITRYGDTGAILGGGLPVMLISRSTGDVSFAGIVKGRTLLASNDQSTTIAINSVQGSACNVLGQNNGSIRWAVQLGNATPQGADNTGLDFAISCYDNSGAPLYTPVQITRRYGEVIINSGMVTKNSITIETNPDNIAAAFYNSRGGNDIVVGFGATATGWWHNLLVSPSNFRFTCLNVSVDGGINWGGSSGDPGAYNAAMGGSVRGDGINGSYFCISRKFGPAAFYNINEDNSIQLFQRSGVIVGSVGVTSNSTSFYTSSDERLKGDLKSFDAGSIIDQTKVYDFAWKDSGKRAFGVVAQQAQTIYPQAVFHDPEKDWWGVDYSKYVPVLLQEAKTARDRIAALEAKVEQLMKLLPHAEQG